MAYATTAELLARLQQASAIALSSDGVAVDEVRLELALDDASAELDGWLLRLPDTLRPDASTLRTHAIRVALYLITLDRPGVDFDHLRRAYEGVVAFYTGLVAQAAAEGGAASVEGTGSSCAPDPAFNDDSLKGFV